MPLRRADGTTKIYYVPANTAWMAWHRASLRRDMRAWGWLGGEETLEEAEILAKGPPDARDRPET
jgi:hypothetical protein